METYYCCQTFKLKLKEVFLNVTKLRWIWAGPALGIGDIGGRLGRHLLEGRREVKL